MIKNYLKTAWRYFWKNKFSSSINITGLVLGLVCSVVILLWVQNELSIDAFHANRSYLYQVYERQYYNHKVEGQYSTPGLLADEMKKVIPEVEYATSLSYSSQKTFAVGNKILKMEGRSARVDLFKMFSYHLLQGNEQTALNAPVSIAISRKMADEFFGSPLAAMGKTIRYENREDYLITAVYENLGENSSKKFDFLINWDAFLKENEWARQWGNTGVFTYVKLRTSADPLLVDQKITHFLNTYDKGQSAAFREELGIQKFGDVYLHGDFKNGKIEGGRIEYVHLFSIIAIFILLIACINFMNLTTAHSVKRAKEIGVRKVVGAFRSVLFRQFIGEALLLTMVAVIISLALVVLLLPVFNSVTQKQISLPFTHSYFWLCLLGITLVTGFISGSYPALFLSSFNPIKVLKGTIKLGSGATWFRKGLVVFQFVLSVVLIVGAIVISKQVNYLQTKNLGYDRKNLIYIPLEGELAAKYKIFKDEALKMPGIQFVTRVTNTPTNFGNSTGSVNWDGKDPNSNVEFTQVSVGYDFVGTMRLKMLAGRDYSREFISDSLGYIINETALKKIGYADPIGKSFTLWGDRKGKIIGVLKDFHFNSLHDLITPLVIMLRENEKFGGILIRTRPGQTKQALKTIETLCKQLNPNFAFTYAFSDEEYRKQYDNEQMVGELSDAFAFLAIFISCLGLLGLATFVAEQRIKEIGIRKVLGASVGSMVALLSKEFLILVLVALFIASPIAWFALDKWLQNYAYRTSIGWWVFVFAGLIAILITLITVSFQAVKAAMVNPVKSLRSE